MNIEVIKADGEKEFFDREKLIDSLKRAGAPQAVVENIVSRIEGELIQDMSTSDIYRHAFSLLRESHKPVAVRYSLRRALVGFGPSGFPFEDYVGEIFKAQGYEVETGETLQGGCVEHEVDLIGWKADDLIMGEVKFHNELGFKTDLKIALYVKARMDDLRAASFFLGGKKRKLGDGYLITNTKFTKSVIQYASCSGLRLLGWSYPETENLQILIEKSKLHPLSCLTSVSNLHKRDLFDKGIVLCKTIFDSPDVLDFLNLSREDKESIIIEVKGLFS